MNHTSTAPFLIVCKGAGKFLGQHSSVLDDKMSNIDEQKPGHGTTRFPHDGPGRVLGSKGEDGLTRIPPRRLFLTGTTK